MTLALGAVAFFTGVLVGVLISMLLVWQPLDGLIKLINHTPKG